MSKQLLFVENQDPLFTDKLSYLENAEFTDKKGKPLYDENPPHTSNEMKRGRRKIPNQ
jgi:type IV secretory pathway TraG/TraD family ATPase VirD4